MPARGPSNLYYRRPRLLALTLFLIVVAGVASLQVLPRAEDPALTERWATVFTSYPGASAERVESLVTERIEDEMQEIEEIEEIRTISRADISTMVIELSDDVGPDEVDEVWARVRDRLGDVESRFPPNVGKPVFREFQATTWTLLIGLRWDLPGPPQRVILSRLADELGDDLRRVPGTDRVKYFGEPEEEITVEVDPARLAAYGMTVQDVADAVRRDDSKIPAGQVRGSNNRLFIEVAGELDSLARIRDLPIRRGANGRFLRLEDIGTVRKGIRKPEAAMALIAGEEGVVVASRMLIDQRIDLWAAKVRTQVENFRTRLPRGVKLTVLFDQSRYTDARLGSLVGNFFAAAGLVVLVILFSMGWRSALVVGTALPLTTLMVLQGLQTIGVPINQMSVTGLIIALGLLIDNAIIMVDEVRRRLDAGMHPRDAVSHGVGDLAVPLLGSTLTTIFAFMPIALMPGSAGEFVGGIAISVIIALVSSLFLAMTVVPALTGLLDHAVTNGRRNAEQSATWSERGVGHASVTRAYKRLLLWLSHHPAASLGIACFLPVLGLVAFTQLEEQFFPPAERDQFAIEIRLPWQATIDQTRREAIAARAELLQHPMVEEVHWFLGESAPTFYYNLIEAKQGVDFYAQGLVQLRTAEGAASVQRELQDRLDARFPRAQILARQLEQGPPFDAPVELRIFGPGLSQLRAIGQRLRAELAAIPGVTHTLSTMEGGQPKLMVELDEEKARLAGFDNTAIADFLQGSLEGRVGGSMIEGTENLPVRVRVREDDRRVVDIIAALELPGRDRWTPLANFSKLRLVPDAATIPHRDGQRCNTVQAFLVAGMLPSKVLGELMRRLEAKEFALPSGYDFKIAGEAAERDQAVGDLASTAVVLLVLMVASLVLSFNSFRMAAIIAGVAFLSVGLALLAIFVFGHPFGFMAIVGTMGLIGVAVNDSIVVLAALNKNEAAKAGDREAVVQIVMNATRHLVSTSLTTMAGFTPLILAGGGFWPPVAVAIGGGVAGATLLAVTFVPTLFLLWQRR